MRNTVPGGEPRYPAVMQTIHGNQSQSSSESKSSEGYTPLAYLDEGLELEGSSEEIDDEDSDEDDIVPLPMTLRSSLNGTNAPIIRPGIIHRLDKGTTGLIVVARDDTSLTNLGEQFKAREVRVLCSISVDIGCPLLCSHAQNVLPDCLLY